MKRLVFGAVLIAVLTAVATSIPAMAAEQIALGVVDQQRLELESRGMQEANQQYQELAGGQQQQLQQQYKIRLLSDEEKQELLDLSSVAAPTEARDTRLSELEQLSDQREQRLMDLRQSKERNPDEEAEYKRLNDIYERRMAELTALQTELQQQRQAKGDELLKGVRENLAKAVKKVAEQKKLLIVLDKQVVLYGGLDITDQVLAELNGESAAAQ